MTEQNEGVETPKIGDLEIPRRYYHNRSGKDFVLYGGLLWAAKELGLEGIDTDLLQAPSESNNGEAIVKAVVTMENGKHFSGIGDASAENVNRNIATHKIRMAETRAKARALRDAIGVDEASFEELSEEGSPDHSGSSQRRGRSGNQSNQQRSQRGGNDQAAPTRGGATPKQVAQIEEIANQKFDGIPVVEGGYKEFKRTVLKGKDASEVSREGADKLLNRLTQKSAEVQRAAAAAKDPASVPGVQKGVPAAPAADEVEMPEEF